MKIFQVYLLLGTISIMHSTDDCYCHEDCEALTNVINQQNQQRTQPGPDKEFIQSETDTSTCERNTQCCVQVPSISKLSYFGESTPVYPDCGEPKDWKYLFESTSKYVWTRVTSWVVSRFYSCRNGWIQNEGRCYHFISCSHGCTANEARSACRGELAELAKVSSAAQEKFFIRSLNKTIIILGGHLDKQGTWRWPDNSLFSDGYTNWQSGFSNRRKGTCMVLFRSNKWQNVVCKSKLKDEHSQGYICESS